MLVERHVFHDDLGAAGAERLFLWCQERGADTFTVSVIGAEPGITFAAASLEERLTPFRVDPRRVRAIPAPEPGSSWTNPSQLWVFNAETMAVLRGCFPRGLLTYFPENGAWFEDPCLYRGGELMLGVISHEGEAVLRIEARQQLELDQSGISYRLKGEWVGF